MAIRNGLSIVILVMVSLVCTHVKTYQIVCLKYVESVVNYISVNLLKTLISKRRRGRIYLYERANWGFQLLEKYLLIWRVFTVSRDINLSLDC